MPIIPLAPEPRYVVAPDGVQLATYDDGDPVGPVVVALHGFASSAQVNWYATGWVRELTRGGFRVMSMDQRGHGRSEKPHEPAAYSMQQFVADVEAVLDTYLLDDVALVGYSLGARVGWHAALGTEHRVTRAVLGGIPDGYPLTRFRTDEAEAFVATGAPVADRLTRAYIDMAARTEGNDLAALVALVRGMQGGLQPDPDAPPRQPVLFATGSEDGILDASRRLAAATPSGRFFEIPGRNHFNAPTSRPFRDAAIAFLQEAPVGRRADGRADAATTVAPTSPGSDGRANAAADPAAVSGSSASGATDAAAASASGADLPADALTPTTAWQAGLAAMTLLLPTEVRAGADDRALEAMLRARWPEWTAALSHAGESGHRS